MDFELMSRAVPILLQATTTTVEVTCISFILGFLWGVILAVGELSTLKIVSMLSRVYVAIFRGVPLLIVLFAVYFGFPQVGWNIEALTAGIMGLVLNLGAFTAEIIRAGILSIDKGQTEAGLALGMNRMQVMIYVVFPQVMRVMIAPLSNELINVIKDSSLISIVTVVELTLATQRLVSSTFKPLELYILSGGIYLIMTTSVGRFASFLESKYSLNWM
jgi:polar amino acid transport system permease protein